MQERERQENHIEVKGDVGYEMIVVPCILPMVLEIPISLLHYTHY